MKTIKHLHVVPFLLLTVPVNELSTVSAYEECRGGNKSLFSTRVSHDYSDTEMTHFKS